MGCRPAAGLLAAALTALMARLVWGAVSGMEVSLYVCLALLGLVWHVRYGLDGGWRSYLATLAFALAAHARPECYVLFPAAWLAHLVVERNRPWHVARAMLPHLALYGLLMAPQWAFNMATIGSIFPATFHAKVQGGLFEALRNGDSAGLIQALTTRPLGFLLQYAVFWLENNAVLFLPALWGLVVLAVLSPASPPPPLLVRAG